MAVSEVIAVVPTRVDPVETLHSCHEPRPIEETQTVESIVLRDMSIKWTLAHKHAD